MIVFDLACPAGHVFEGWFGSSDDYEGQRARGLVSCPVCGSGEVAKAVMAPRLGSGTGEKSTRPVAMTKGGDPTPAAMKAMLGEMARMQARMLEKSEHVGPRFAAEARAIHAGDKPDRLIHGQATPSEAKALIEDGVPVAPLPLPVRPPGSDN